MCGPCFNWLVSIILIPVTHSISLPPFCRCFAAIMPPFAAVMPPFLLPFMLMEDATSDPSTSKAEAVRCHPLIVSCVPHLQCLTQGNFYFVIHGRPSESPTFPTSYKFSSPLLLVLQLFAWQSFAMMIISCAMGGPAWNTPPYPPRAALLVMRPPDGVSSLLFAKSMSGSKFHSDSAMSLLFSDG